MACDAGQLVGQARESSFKQVQPAGEAQAKLATTCQTMKPRASAASAGATNAANTFTSRKSRPKNPTTATEVTRIRSITPKPPVTPPQKNSWVIGSRWNAA